MIIIMHLRRHGNINGNFFLNKRILSSDAKQKKTDANVIIPTSSAERRELAATEK